MLLVTVGSRQCHYDWETILVLRSLRIENFKCFQTFEIEFGRLNLLVGGNNSGKTTIFHALQLCFWAIDQVANTSGENVVLGKTQTSEIPVIPYSDMRDLFFRQRLRAGRTPTHIKVTLRVDGAPEISIEMYQAYGRNFMIAGNDVQLTREQFTLIQNMNPVFVPSAVGITAREDYYRPISLRSMIHQGRQNQVLRNMVFQLRESGEWHEFATIIAPLFRLQGIDVPFQQDTDLWLKAIYQENGCSLDFVSAGSGFLQVVNLLTFIFRSPTQVALLDEPDSHMHEDLLRLAFGLLDRLSEKRQIQLLVATHSPVLIDAAGLENVLLVDRSETGPRRAQNVEALVPLLADRGLSLPPSKVMDTLKSRRVLFVEGSEKDYEEFILAFGVVSDADFAFKARGLSVFQIGDGRKDWPFDAIQAFERLIGVSLQYVYVSDRDFLLPEQVQRREARALAEGQTIYHLERRNRECYVVEPAVLARLLQTKWDDKHSGQPPPPELERDRIRGWFVDWARTQEDSTRTNLTVESEPYLRGDANHRTAKTQELNTYFREVFTDPLARNEIPYRLLDGKEAIKAFRRYVAETFGLSFRDIEIIKAVQPNEIAPDLLGIIGRIRSMFPDQALEAESVSPESGSTREVDSENPPSVPIVKEVTLFDEEVS